MSSSFFPSTNIPSKGEFLDFPKKDSGFTFQGTDESNMDMSASDFSFTVPISRFKIFAGLIVISFKTSSIFIYLFFTRLKARGRRVSKPTPPNSA